MHLRKWIRKKTLFVLVQLLLIFASVLWLIATAADGSSSSDRLPINQARLATGDIRFQLEQTGLEKIKTDREAREALIEQCRRIGAELMLVDLSGAVLFDSALPAARDSAPSLSDADAISDSVDLRTALHYDLSASSDAERVKIAFPIVEDAGGMQTGSALFTLDASRVAAPDPNKAWIWPLTVSAVLSAILAWTIFRFRRQLQRRTVEPLNTLKQAAETILKGEYDQKSEYPEPDEMGELYAAFDQMRLEILYLHRERARRERMHKELVTDISHDLKTPLTALKAYIEAIEEGLCADMDEVLDYIGVMRTHTDRMVRLTDDLLVHALNELGQISITPTEIYSGEAFRDILRTIERDITSSGVAYRGPSAHSLHTSQPGDPAAETLGIPNVLIRADVNRIEQVISNLVSNALKHTRSGDTISIGFELEPGFIRVDVADTGTGIDPVDMPFIFERAYKGTAPSGENFSSSTDSLPPSARKNDGNGLGLSICKTIIEAHGGSLSFQSRKGNGTVFRFTLPLC
ncbi:two-component sensor histidine kinase [Saccharibacillus sp. O23]|uniref:sensor histidine kinase n=1 Tax=Saccharibacillus sp. O23 TaxID=2009338 RepID=UPI000B4E6525|nr:HAMP domain-containing sensor histidine kinase [Saccharibacillus sp. O23]OWR31439.1 two-component sensor histidine kinase [Saccharibacillus sp. O23]